MKHLIHTFLTSAGQEGLIKYEIYSKSRKLGHYEKVPEGSCRIISYNLIGDEIKTTNLNVDVSSLFEANRPAPNTLYTDGPDRVNLEMLINHLIKIS